MKFELGVIGAGIMANALLTQIVQKGIIDGNKVTIFDKDVTKYNNFTVLGVNCSASIEDLIKNSKNVLFAVKPQNFMELTVNYNFNNCQNLISIMAGVKINTIREKTKAKYGILRIMPNLPCKVGKGMCALCFDKVSSEDKKFLTELFMASGDTLEITEDKFDAVTSLSGSGPAYIYMFLQGLIKGGISGGLTFYESKKLAIATMEGAVAIVNDSQDDLDTMIDRVCSKGGTTIEAVNIYKNEGLVDLIVKGVDACRRRSEELSGK